MTEYTKELAEGVVRGLRARALGGGDTTFPRRAADVVDGMMREIERLKRSAGEPVFEAESKEAAPPSLRDIATELLTNASELAQYASYAETTGGVTVNRHAIRKWCDRVFDTIRKLPEGRDLEPYFPEGSITGPSLAESARFVVSFMERQTGLPFGDMIGQTDAERIKKMAEGIGLPEPGAVRAAMDDLLNEWGDPYDADGDTSAWLRDVERRINDVDAAIRAGEMSRTATPAPVMNTGLKDANGEPIHLGDIVLYRFEGSHTNPDYWNPEYEVIWKAPAFTLKHVGGGRCGGSLDFKLRCGGGNGDLFIIKRAGAA